MSPSIPPRLPLRARSRQRKRILFSLVATGVVCFWAAVFVLYSRDEPRPDVTDLELAPLQLDEDENAYALLVRVALKLPGSDETDAREVIDGLVAGGEWDAAAAAEVLPDIDFHVLEAEVEGALAIGSNQATWLSSPMELVPCVPRLRYLAGVLQLHALSLLHEGRGADALRVALAAARVGHAVETSRGNLIQYLTGLAIQRRSLDVIERIAATEPIPSDDLARGARTLEQFAADNAAIVLAIKSEHRFFEAALAELSEEGLGNMLGNEEAPWFIRHGHRLPLALKRNRTRRLNAEILRAAIAASEGDAGAARAVSIEIGKRVPSSSRLNPNNFIGETVLRIAVPTWEKVLLTRLRHRSRIVATQAALAARAYESDFGELPGTLEALVPDFMSAVPSDPFDGAPIRYSRERRVIWSVGENNVTTPVRESEQASGRKPDAVSWLDRPPAE